jgi:hypothetical protein
LNCILDLAGIVSIIPVTIKSLLGCPFKLITLPTGSSFANTFLAKDFVITIEFNSVRRVFGFPFTTLRSNKSNISGSESNIFGSRNSLFLYSRVVYS